VDSHNDAESLSLPVSLLGDRRFRTGVVVGAGIALGAWLWLHFGHGAPLEQVSSPLAIPGHSSPAGSASRSASEQPLRAPTAQTSSTAQASSTAQTSTVESPPWHELTVQRGDTLSSLFREMGLPASAWIPVMKVPKARKILRHLRPGRELRYRIASDGDLQALSYPLDLTHRLVVSRAEHGYRASVGALPVEHRQARATGTVEHSLFNAAQSAGLSQRLTMNLTHIFKWEVNFKQSVRTGDYFEVVYRQLWKHGQKLRNGGIVAAQYVNRGHRYRAYRFTLPDGKTSYYKADGRSVSKGIERAPLHYKYISSPFSYHRYDPVVHVWRPHYGVDYAAPTGTPVHAAADGRVIWARRDGGYGNLVVIRSFGRYKTYYAHLRRFARGIHKGMHVHQGELIGYVGQTGEATGPHLHFGIMVNGRWRNPRTVPLPSNKPIPHKYLAEFKQRIKPLKQALDTMEAQRRQKGQPTRVATASRETSGN